jgi:Fe-S cluster assembly protein SufD
MTMIPDWMQHNWDKSAHTQNPQRQAAWHDFIKTGLPTKKNENWKYTDLSCLTSATSCFSLLTDQDINNNIINNINAYRLNKLNNNILLVLINGRFVPALSDEISNSEKSIIICRLEEAKSQYNELIQTAIAYSNQPNQHVFANLNSAMWQDGLFLYVPDHSSFSQPIHILSLVTDACQFAAHTKHVLVAGKCTNLTLLTEYASLTDTAYMNHENMHILMQVQSRLHHSKIQRESSKAIHLSQTFIKQEKDSEVVSAYFTMGGIFSRDDVIVQLQEKGADCRLAGFYHLNQNQQYIDHHVYINHHAPHTKSDMLYKGIVDNKTRAVFNGEVFVAKNAQKISAEQANHHLLLSSLAEVYAKPVLEIYADEVKCQHGATTGQLDTEALFYLCSRGIPKSDAIQILLQSFVKEIIEKVAHIDIKQRVKEAVR